MKVTRSLKHRYTLSGGFLLDSASVIIFKAISINCWRWSISDTHDLREAFVNAAVSPAPLWCLLYSAQSLHFMHQHTFTTLHHMTQSQQSPVTTKCKWPATTTKSRKKANDNYQQQTCTQKNIHVLHRDQWIHFFNVVDFWFTSNNSTRKSNMYVTVIETDQN